MPSLQCRISAVALIACAACSTNSQQPATTNSASASTLADLSGRYSIEMEIDSRPTTGTIELTPDGEGYGGTITAKRFPAARITSVRVTDDVVMIIAETPDGPLEIKWRSQDGVWAGDWSMGQRSGKIRGRALKKS